MLAGNGNMSAAIKVLLRVVQRPGHPLRSEQDRYESVQALLAKLLQEQTNYPSDD